MVGRGCLLAEYTEVKLNLGSEFRYLEGYINIDCNSQTKPDICCRIEELKYDDNSVDEIYAAHILEHLDWKGANKMFQKFHNWLKKEGKLYIVVPDLESIARIIIKEGMGGNVGSWLFGRHDISEPQGHRWGYTVESLEKALIDVGFRMRGLFTPEGGDDSFYQAEEKLSLSLWCVK